MTPVSLFSQFLSASIEPSAEKGSTGVHQTFQQARSQFSPRLSENAKWPAEEGEQEF